MGWGQPQGRLHDSAGWPEGHCSDCALLAAAIRAFVMYPSCNNRDAMESALARYDRCRTPTPKVA